jgi:hypothetical protein
MKEAVASLTSTKKIQVAKESNMMDKVMTVSAIAPEYYKVRKSKRIYSIFAACFVKGL